MYDLPFMYMEKLNIPSGVNFGLELEIDKIDPDKVYKLVRREFGNSWIVKTDDSLTKGQNSEIVSPNIRITIPLDAIIIISSFCSIGNTAATSPYFSTR